jgi:hypothetical protein
MSTIRQIILFVLSLALALSLVKCKHEPMIDPNGPQCGEATTIDEMMEWVYFKTGTYWVYREQNSGTLDTVTVYYDYNGVHPSGNRDFVVKMRSSLDGYTYEYWFNDAWSGDCDLLPSCFCRVVDCDKYVPGDYAGGNHVFIFPLKVGNQVGQGGYNLEFGPSKIVAHYQNDSIQNFEFTNVFEIHQAYSPQHNYEQSSYKIVNRIGIVQKSIPEYSENWEIIDYHVHQ